MKLLKEMLYMAAIVVIAALTSCTSKNDNTITHIAFQESKGGWWGMIGMDGEVLFINQFKNEPTAAKNGFFLVKNADGFWEYYTAEKKPEKKGTQYVTATLFENGVALAVEPNKPVAIINTKFEVVKTLDQIEGRKITSVMPFKGGYAVVSCGDVSGVIDTQGNVVLAPAFDEVNNNGDGTFCVVDVNDKEHKYDYDEKVKMQILNAKGEKIGSYPYQYTSMDGEGGPLDSEFKDSLAIACNTGEKYDYNSGIINIKGDFVVKPSDETSNISELHCGLFSFYSSKDEGMGAKRTNGEVILKPAYNAVTILAADRLAIGTNKDKDDISSDDDEEYGDCIDYYWYDKDYYMVDLQGNRLGSGIYEEIKRFSEFDGKHTVARINTEKYTIIDYEGNELPNLPTLYNIGMQTGDYCLNSDFVDVDALVNELKITQDGIYGVSMSTKPSSTINIIDSWSKSPEFCTGLDEVTAYKTLEGVYTSLRFVYDGKIAYQSYTTRRVIDGYNFYTYYYHDEKIPGGYHWKDVDMKAMVVEFDNSTNLHGKLKLLRDAIVKKLKSVGNVVYDDGGATYVNLTSGYQALAVMNANRLCFVLGDLKPSERLSLSQFKSVKEKVYNYEDLEDINWKEFLY